MLIGNRLDRLLGYTNTMPITLEAASSGLCFTGMRWLFLLIRNW
jgi:hypothetical protein